MQLDADQLDQYRRDGYLFLPGRFAPEEAAALRAEADVLYATERDEVWRESSGAPRTAFAAHLWSEPFRRLGRHPRLVRPVEQILGGPVYMHQYKVNAKAPFDGEVWQWHQDYGTWQRDDDMPEPLAMNIAVFLDEVTAANGPLLFIPGSHVEGVYEAGHDLATTSYPLWTLDRATITRLAERGGVVAPTGPPGSVILFSGCLVHASPPNISPFGRVIVYLSLCRVDNHIRRFKRAEWIAHRDFTPIEPLADDCLADLVPSAAGAVNLHRLAVERAASGRPVRVGLIGAGKFGSMFLAQVPHSPLVVTAIADLDVERARRSCREVGWPEPQVDATTFLTSAEELVARPDVDVVVEATGNPVVGVDHALACFAAGKHLVAVNVEADALCGPLLAQAAADAGVVYSLAYGDQPALVCEQVDWARSCGFEVVAAGKGTKHHPSYHQSTPDTIWDHYGLTAAEAAAAGMSSQMFNSFLDGTKSAIEMCAIANATGLTPAPDGLRFPPCGVDDLPHLLRPADEGGVLHHKGQVEVVSCLEVDFRPVYRDLRWGVYVVLEAPSAYAAACFAQYGLRTDASGRYAAMYKPFHLIGLELNVSILSAALRGEATGSPTGWRADVVATAKRDLRAGEVLDGEGGYRVYGTLLPAADSVARGGLPLGLAHGVELVSDIPAGQSVRWADVRVDQERTAHRLRKQLEACLAPSSPAVDPSEPRGIAV